MSAWESFCHKYLMKKNWEERNVYSFGRAFCGCYSQHLYWLQMKWYKRMYRIWYRLISFEPFESVKIKHRVSNEAKYKFKNFKDCLR